MATPYERFQRDGHPVLRESAVLFLDVLGTAKIRSPAEAQEHLERTIAALEQARDWGDSDPGDTTEVVSWFSDNLGFAVPVDPSSEDAALGLVIGAAQEHQCALVNHGFVGRGGIAVGLFYAEANVLYGPALNDAVALEKATRVPRVALDQVAVDAAKRHMERFWGNGAGADARRMLAVDGDLRSSTTWISSNGPRRRPTSTSCSWGNIAT